jgi:secreted trypsin-like serine protease
MTYSIFSDINHSLINRSVLTAAHCLFNPNTNAPIKPSDIVVVLGHERRTEKNVNTMVKNVAKIIVHKNYSSVNMVADIGVLRLEGVVPDVHPTIRVVPYTTELADVNTTCLITGWGTMRYGGGTIPNVLQKANVPILSRAICKNDTQLGEYFVDGMLCAGYLDGTIDTCQGDSGGPLVCGNKLVGITSFGYKCAALSHPGIYTDIYYYKEWIKENSGARYFVSWAICLGLAVLVMIVK